MRPVARADVLQADGDRGLRQRSGQVGIGDPRPAVDQLQHALPGGDRRAQVANRAGEGLDGVEGGQREQRQHRDQHPVEPPLRVRLDGHPEDAGHGGADGAELEAVADAGGERVASADAYEQAVGCAHAREPVAFLGRRRPAPAPHCSSSTSSAASRPRATACRSAAHLASRPETTGTADARQQEPAREHERRSGQERRGDADAHGPRDGCDEQRVEAAQVEVLERVDVGDQAGEQVAPPIPLELGRRQRLDPLVGADPNARERAEGEVVRDEPLEVAGQRTGETEEANGDDRDRQRQDRRALGGPRDQVAGGRHQAAPKTTVARAE